jgi:hypothetical protein
MDAEALKEELGNCLSAPRLAADLVDEFVELRRDCKTNTLGRASIGKFIESVVRVLQQIENGEHQKDPSVDHYLRTLESRESSLGDGLRICCARVARACYTLRNKRSIVHKNELDPNRYDLKYVYASAQWIMSEIVRDAITQDLSLANELIEFVQVPVAAVVEVMRDRKIVHGDHSTEEEIMLLLHSEYPDYVALDDLKVSLQRRSARTITRKLDELWKSKQVSRSNGEYKLTQTGYQNAEKLLVNARHAVEKAHQ